MYLHAGRFFPRGYKTEYLLFSYDGVGIFFVLSGFLIGRILINQLMKYQLNKNFLLDFWIRRWFRTLPNYLLILLLLTLVTIINGSFLFDNVIKYFFFLQNFNSDIGEFFFESWSLAIEEWFYLILPISILLMFVVTNNTKISLLLAMLAILIFCNYFRISVFNLNDFSGNYAHSVLGRLDSIVYGVLGAYVSIFYNKIWTIYKKHFLIVGLFLLIISRFMVNTVVYSVLIETTHTSVTILFLLPYFSQLYGCKNVFVRNFVIFVSIISYSIYLLNIQVSDFLSSGINWDWVVDYLQQLFNINSGLWTLLLFMNYVLFFVLTILISTLLYKYYEVPMTNLRDLPFFKNRFKKTLK